jgi:hypothetical protein
LILPDAVVRAQIRGEAMSRSAFFHGFVDPLLGATIYKKGGTFFGQPGRDRESYASCFSQPAS